MSEGSFVNAVLLNLPVKCHSLYAISFVVKILSTPKDIADHFILGR